MIESFVEGGKVLSKQSSVSHCRLPFGISLMQDFFCVIVVLFENHIYFEQDSNAIIRNC